MSFLQNFGLTNSADMVTGMLMLIMICYALGDIASYKTKAVFSMIFVTGFIFLFGFWYGFPATIFKDTALQSYAVVSLPFILVHMGTMMKLKDIKQEWKTVLIAFFGLIGLSIGLFFIAGPILGKVMALTAAGPISGGIVATIIVQDAAKAVGAENLVVFATLLLVLQNFVGLPIASMCLKIEGNRLLTKHRSGEAEAVTQAVKSDPEVPTWKLFPATPKPLRTPFAPPSSFWRRRPSSHGSPCWPRSISTGWPSTRGCPISRSINSSWRSSWASCSMRRDSSSTRC